MYLLCVSISISINTFKPCLLVNLNHGNGNFFLAPCLVNAGLIKMIPASSEAREGLKAMRSLGLLLETEELIIS